MAAPESAGQKSSRSDPASAQPPGKRGRQPQAEAAKTVQQFAPESSASLLAQSRQHLPRAILGVHQMSYVRQTASEAMTK
jgi:hypothetical protein